MRINPILAADFYKVGHKFQYPEGTGLVYSNFTARSDRLAVKTGAKSDGNVLFYGLQGFIKWYLMETFDIGFFERPKTTVVAEYKKRVEAALCVENFDASHIAELHDLGYLPIEIRALPEGTLVPIKVPVLTIHNTLPQFYWLTNYLETVLSAELWKATCTATIAYKYRELLEQYATKTGSPKDFVLWQGHDFSFRGLSGVHDAASSGSAHLVSFLGTDTIPAMDYLDDYYYGTQTFVGGSVPATEHSVMCMGGKETEIETFRRLIKDVYPAGVVSIVSDTWDFWKVVTEYATELKPEILNRKPNAIGLSKVVFRPDSGDPVEVLAGVEITDFTNKIDPDDEDELHDWARDLLSDQAHSEIGYEESGDIYVYFKVGHKHFKATCNAWWNSYENTVEIEDVSVYEIGLTPAEKGAVQCLWEVFGGTTTETGHKLLDSHVGLIYGDSITLERATAILKRLEAKGFASANVVFGIGSFTYQYNTRDTYGFAVKSTAGSIDGEFVEIFKDPVTDVGGVKKSAKGFLRVERIDGKLTLLDQQDHIDGGELEIVYRNGQLLRDESLETIRGRVNSSLTT